MITSAPKMSIILIALILSISVITVGCGNKKQAEWVNTASLPGHAFDSNGNLSNSKNNFSSTVYLGDPNAPNVQFGPRDVSFNFRDLR